jgi:hypothetical protein
MVRLIVIGRGRDFIIELEAVEDRFFSQDDEKTFLKWLDELPFVSQYEGSGRSLFISVNAEAVDAEGLVKCIPNARSRCRSHAR